MAGGELFEGDSGSANRYSTAELASLLLGCLLKMNLTVEFDLIFISTKSTEK